MPSTHHRRLGWTAAFVTLSLLAAPTTGRAQDDERSLDRAREKLEHQEPLPDRPVQIGDRIVWSDHRLAGLCQGMGGLFRKLAGRAEYMCLLPRLADSATPATPME